MGPVMISVPHAGRAYSAAMADRSRVPPERLMKLEDRYADRLIAGLLECGYPALVAHLPRAVIDLNRDPRDIDPKMIADIPRHLPIIQTAKQRAGLGLFPRSLPRYGGLWRGAMSWAEAEGRIKLGHEAYHQRLAEALNHCAAYHDQIILMDVHSMPPLATMQGDGKRADVVVGDLYGASASSRLSEIALNVVKAHGLVGALNQPYPGSYVLERHGRPLNGRHAIQLEISRDLYLDDSLAEPGEGMAAMQVLLVDMAEQLTRAVSREPRTSRDDGHGWACAAE